MRPTSNHRALCVPLFAVAAAGCGSSDGASQEADPASEVVGAKTGELSAPPEGDGLQLRQTFGPLEPGEEVHFCQYYVLPGGGTDVQRFQHTYTKGGHHVILYPTKLDASDVEGKLGSAFDCDREAPTRGDVGFAYVGAGTDGEQKYPDGVAWHFEGSEVVILESHMLNTGDAPLDVDYRLNLWFPTTAVKDHVGTIFFYDNSIYVPELGEATVNMSCVVPSSIELLALAPHMHVRGVHFESRLTGDGATAPRDLVGTDDWSSLEATRYDPPLPISAGQRFDFRCDYANPDARVVVEGSSKTENEMCLLIGSYYPKLDFPFEFCMNEGSGPVFSGAKTCGESLSCFVSAPDPVAAEKCVVETCEKSSRAFDGFFSCVAQECFFPGHCEGTANDPECDACAVERCAAAMSVCQATTCE